MEGTLQIEIVTPERRVVHESALEITIPGKKGCLGILPGHAPLISELAVGEINYRVPDGQSRYLAVAWGFVEVLPDKVTILAETAERGEEIDILRAQKAREAAEAIVKANRLDDAHAQAEAALVRAQNRLVVAQKIQS